MNQTKNNLFAAANTPVKTAKTNEPKAQHNEGPGKSKATNNLTAFPGTNYGVDIIPAALSLHLSNIILKNKYG